MLLQGQQRNAVEGPLLIVSSLTLCGVREGESVYLISVCGDQRIVTGDRKEKQRTSRSEWVRSATSRLQ